MNQQQLNQLFRYAMSLTRHADEAFDLLQSALEKCCRKQPPELSMPYIRTVIRNQFIDDCRRKKVVAFEPEENMTTLLIDPQDLESMIIDQKYIDTLLEHLSTSEREILFLWAVEGFTAQEISQQLSVPRNTVLSHFYRIRKKLQQLDTSLSNMGEAL